MTNNWLILTAVELEANAIRKALRGREIPIEVIGIRAARFDAQKLRDFNAIILAGLAGGLNPSLKIGDCVVSVPHEATEFPVHMSILQSTLDKCPFAAYIGGITTSQSLVSTPGEKTKLFRKTSALAVDMEGDIVLAAAQKMKCSMIHIRGISDTADECLPPDLVNWVNETGRVKPLSAMKGLLKNPMQIASLAQLGKNSKLAAKNMARVVGAFVGVES